MKVGKTHPHQWLWEPLEADAGFALAPMFGGKAVYLDGKLMLFFIAKSEPWNGMLVCTDRAHHPALLAEFPSLSPHPVLPKWLYLPESTANFEKETEEIVVCVKNRDPRIGVAAKAKKKKRLS